MSQKPSSDLIYIHLTYVPKGQENKFQNHEFGRQDEFLMSDFILNEGEAPFRFLYMELMRLPANPQILFTEFVTTSQNPAIFCIDGKRFDRLIIVLGKETIYWTYYMDKPNGESLSGEAYLKLNYCKKCIHKQYLDIVKGLRNYLKQFYPTTYSLSVVEFFMKFEARCLRY